MNKKSIILVLLKGCVVYGVRSSIFILFMFFCFRIIYYLGWGESAADKISLGELTGESTGRKKGESPPPEMEETEDSVPVSKEFGEPLWGRRRCCWSWSWWIWKWFWLGAKGRLFPVVPPLLQLLLLLLPVCVGVNPSKPPTRFAGGCGEQSIWLLLDEELESQSDFLFKPKKNSWLLPDFTQQLDCD